MQDLLTKVLPFLFTVAFYFMCVGVCLHVCLFTMYAVACRGQKKTSDFLERELQTVVKCSVGARNQTLALYESSWCS